MRPAGPRGITRADELHVRLVDEGRRLERVLGPLGGERSPRDRPELVIDERQQPLDPLVVRERAVEQEIDGLVRTAPGRGRRLHCMSRGLAHTPHLHEDRARGRNRVSW